MPQIREYGKLIEVSKFRFYAHETFFWLKVITYLAIVGACIAGMVIMIKGNAKMAKNNNAASTDETISLRSRGNGC